MAEFILVIDHSNVLIKTEVKVLLKREILKLISVFILVKNLTSVQSRDVGKNSQRKAIWWIMKDAIKTRSLTNEMSEIKHS